MNILLWVLQVLLALHTLIGAVWKFSHSAAETMPSLAALSGGVWRGMAVAELLIAACLIVPAFVKPVAWLVPLAALAIVAEMLLFCALHLRSSTPDTGPLIYWLITAALCGFVAYGRLVLRPF